jgi:hypothetical protein
MTVMKHWGYKNSTGRSGLALAALKKFGMLEEVGKGKAEDRRLQLTQLADDILNHPSSDAKHQAIQTAALNPSIHRELWEEYGRQLPSDANLEFNLRRNRGFTESGAAEFVREYRETMEFAGLIGDHLEETEPDPDVFPRETEANANAAAAPAAEQPAEISFEAAVPGAPGLSRGKTEQVVGVQGAAGQAMQSYPIPIALQGRPPVVITGAFPLTESEWAQFNAVLTAMKPVLVGAPAATEVQPIEAADD